MRRKADLFWKANYLTHIITFYRYKIMQSSSRVHHCRLASTTGSATSWETTEIWGHASCWSCRIFTSAKSISIGDTSTTSSIRFDTIRTTRSYSACALIWQRCTSILRLESSLIGMCMRMKRRPGESRKRCQRTASSSYSAAVKRLSTST